MDFSEDLNKYTEFHKYLKQLCYGLTNRFGKYCAENDVAYWIYDFSETNIDDLDFWYDGYKFNIGNLPERYDDSTRYTSFSKDELINPELIREKVNVKIEECRLTKLKQEYYSQLSKQRVIDREKELYLLLKEKYGNEG
jgi:hypothetical protein